MSLGHFLYSKSLEPLPLSAENCPKINELFPQMLNTSIGPQYEQSYTFEGKQTPIHLLTEVMKNPLHTPFKLIFGYRKPKRKIAYIGELRTLEMISEAAIKLDE
ncbi:hypothetical protein Avbf_08981 [Armadillidium vulgare]|nr:hypothetical protein Avbf_08981 [Armadillidium vulgare]